jgi:tRNA G18 (ribose-2'-O)-methylase SpoU
LRGLLSLQAEYADVTGEIVPPHLLTVIESFLKDELAKELQVSQSTELILPSGKPDTTTITSASSISISANCIPMATQIKRLPFDDLQLSIDERVLNRQQNQAGRKRQELIVCASLVDKPVNLAGIARTCEIFAVNSLILPSMAIVKTDAFQGIAVSSENWLPMTAVPESNLLVYLRSMRRQGYCIVALEQSDSSKSLADPNNIIPDRSVLLLGKEREGIPVEYLSEVDICVEIPQYGVIRSLNVHVSAALFIWEATRRNPEFNSFL